MEQLQYRLQRDNEVTKERIEKAIAERYTKPFGRYSER